MIIPVAAESSALRGVALLMQSIEKVQSRINPALEVDGVLITMYTKTLHCEEVCQRVYEAFSEKVFHTFISRSIKLPDSTVAAAPVWSMPLSTRHQRNTVRWHVSSLLAASWRNDYFDKR